MWCDLHEGILTEFADGQAIVTEKAYELYLKWYNRRKAEDVERVAGINKKRYAKDPEFRQALIAKATAWKAANKDRVKEANRRYREKKKHDQRLQDEGDRAA